MAIRLLSPEDIGKIAAGEVVERPVSIVKELAENSLDAGADRISVELRDGGRERIRISDNGAGIPADDIRLAFTRHATSKISSAGDLADLHTLGFRGEALASIAAVARVEMLTKTADDVCGVHYVIEGGREVLFEEAVCPTGTTVTVDNLFYNVPVRRGFLKSGVQEAAAVTSFMEKLALGRPDVFIKYSSGRGGDRLLSAGNGSLRYVASLLYGRGVADMLLDLDHEADGVRAAGLIGKPAAARRDKSMLSFFVNGRMVKSRLLEDTAAAAFRDYTPPSSYPVGIVNLFTEPAATDVNVHPTKLEVRFTNEAPVREAVTKAIENALKKSFLVPETPAAPEKSAANGRNERVVPVQIGLADKPADKPAALPPERIPEGSRAIPEIKAFVPENAPKAENAPKTENVLKTEKAPKPQDISEPQAPEKSAGVRESSVPYVREKQESSPSGARKEFEDLRLVGQIFDTYWIAESRDAAGQRVFVIDQHAAHERVIYDRFREALEKAELSSQALLAPEVVRVPARLAAYLEENPDALSIFGFDAKAFGENEVIVRAVPYAFGTPCRADAVGEILELSAQERSDIKRDVFLDRLAMAACKAAVKGNTDLSFKEAEALLEELGRSKNPYNCPHGRPTVLQISKYELEKRFKRTGF